jgi:L-cysteine S-thiosulfotransferase
MRLTSTIILIAALLVLVGGCQTGPHSSAGFRLPEDGNAERGKAAFVGLGCNNCHTVTGAELPAATDPRSVSIALGGEKAYEMNDGYLVTSIINPSYKLASYPKEKIAVAGTSLMPSHAEQMTVQQMTDIVVFLQSHYTKKTLPNRYSY